MSELKLFFNTINVKDWVHVRVSNQNQPVIELWIKAPSTGKGYSFGLDPGTYIIQYRDAKNPGVLGNIMLEQTVKILPPSKPKIYYGTK